MRLALGAQIIGILPVFLLGGLFPFLRGELGFATATLGFAVAAFFGASAVGSASLARLTDTTGPWPVARRALLTIAVACVMIAVTQSLMPLLACMVVAGLGNGCIQPATNVAISESVPRHRQGFAFGLKQSSVPLATMIGGLAVPIIGLTVGWRWAFVLAATMALAVVLALPRGAGARGAAAARVAPGPALPLRILIMLGLMNGLGAGSANAMAAFLVASVEDLGHSIAAAGVLMAIGSLVSIFVRLAMGFAADRWPLPLLGTVAAMLLSGALGYAVLAIGTSWGMIASGTMLAFGAGWSWAGLSLLAVVRASTGGTGRTTGIMQAGLFVGAVAGPAGFGLIATTYGYAVAWSVLCAIAGAAALVALRCACELGRLKATMRNV